MPEYGGPHAKVPRPESIDKFIRYLASSKAVEEVTIESAQLINVDRSRHQSLRVFMTNIYIVGLADVYEILSQNKHVDAIVTMSAWNGYTSDAKDFCKEQNIGLFKFGEFLGAVYYNGDRYLNYVPPEERIQRRQR